MQPILDPRRGDFEDDALSTKRRSLLSLFGKLLVEISLPKLAIVWLFILVIPSLFLGLAPLVATIWWSTVKWKFGRATSEIYPVVLLAVVVALGWYGGRKLWRLAESSFWSLNALAVEPIYLIVRESLRYFVEKRLSDSATDEQYRRYRARRGRRRGVLDRCIGTGGAGGCVAPFALVGHHGRSGGDLPASTGGDGEQRCAGFRLSRDCRIGVGYCRCDHGPAANTRNVCRAVRKCAFGKSRICRTYTLLANATAFGWKVVARARAAMHGSGKW